MKRVVLTLSCVVAWGCSSGGGSGPETVYDLDLMPSSAEVVAGASLTLTATLTATPEDPTLDRTLVWTLSGTGSVSPQGEFTAPSPSGNDQNDLTAVITVDNEATALRASATVIIPGAATLVTRGWTAFADEAYATADTRFMEALATVADYGPALSGLGWSDLRRGSLSQAETHLREGVNAGDIEGYGGLVLLHATRDEPTGIITEGLALLSADAAYVSRADAGYAATDVRWFVARAGLDSGNYDVVVSQLDVLMPGHGLNSGAAGFPEQALALLLSLEGEV